MDLFDRMSSLYCQNLRIYSMDRWYGVYIRNLMGPIFHHAVKLFCLIILNPQLTDCNQEVNIEIHQWFTVLFFGLISTQLTYIHSLEKFLTNKEITGDQSPVSVTTEPSVGQQKLTLMFFKISRICNKKLINFSLLEGYAGIWNVELSFVALLVAYVWIIF